MPRLGRLRARKIRFQRLTPWLLLLPALIVIVPLFAGGLAAGLLRSFNYMPVIGLDSPNLAAYSALLRDDEFLPSLLLTTYIALTSTVIASLLALGAVLMIRRLNAGRSLINFLLQLNLTIPHLVGAVGIVYLFSQSGSFARLALHAGFINEPQQFPALIYDPAAIGIILVYVWKELPFIALILLASLQQGGEEFEAVARTLGASRWQVLRFVTLPNLLPALLASSMIVLAFTFGAYEIPALLGAYYPAPLPVLAYRKFTDVDLASRPEAIAISMIIAVLSLIFVLLYAHITRRQIEN